MSIDQQGSSIDLKKVEKIKAAYLSARNIEFSCYQPIPFPEFADIIPQRNSCAERLSMMMNAIPVDSWKGKRVLDLGANLGYFSFEWAKRGASVTAIEYIPENSNFTKEIAQLYNLDCTCIAAPVDLETLSKLEGTYDVVICLALMHHVYAREGIETARKILEKISSISDVMFFEVGQPNEHRKKLKWKKVMRRALGLFPKRGIIREVLNNTAFTSSRVLGYTVNHHAKRWNYLFSK